jgi:hypothetical protein
VRDVRAGGEALVNELGLVVEYGVEDGVERGAVFEAISSAARRRYLLTRQWADEPALPFVMLNPSTASAAVDDPTIRRCMGFARREGAGGLVVANLFTWRATQPAELLSVPDPIGEHADAFLRLVAGDGGRVVVAWGAHQLAPKRGRQVLATLREAGAEVVCLKLTRDGEPGHPLYVRGDAALRPLEIVRVG